MGKDHVGELLHRRLGMQHGPGGRDAFGGIVTDHVYTEQLAGFAMADHAGKPLGVVHGHGFAQIGQGEVADRYGKTLGGCLFGGQADGTDLGEGIDGTGNGSGEVHIMPQGIFDGRHAVGTGRMGKHTLAVGVADAVVALHGSFHLLIHADKAAVGGQADGIQAQVGRVGPPAGCY